MTGPVAVIGAGMGGLAASLRLARAGHSVLVLEAREGPGGLAAGRDLEGLRFDGGPYVLLDRPGLEWAFGELGLDLDEELRLVRVEDLYEVSTPGAPPVRIRASLEATSRGLDEIWPGSGERYHRFVGRMTRAYRRLEPLQRRSEPGPRALLAAGAWREVPLLLSSLRTILARTGLPGPVVDALGIWTHVAGQDLATAPSPLAFVPALVHDVGAFVPEGGVGIVPERLARAATAAGVEFRYATKVRRILVEAGRAVGVETVSGERIDAGAVLANAHGVGVYLDLLDGLPGSTERELRSLPLQSPGVMVFLAIRGRTSPPYLRFRLPGGGQRCRLLVAPSSLPIPPGRDGEFPARLIVPMDHAKAQALEPAGQEEFLRQVLDEPWWREAVGDARVLATRTPVAWGREYHLHRDSMNPVMTARFMRRGRLAHRSPHVRGLYLAGSSTHPGQWVSFCAISGILAADSLCEDLASSRRR